MADGFNRFHTGGQYLYQSQHSRNLHTHRNGSPISNTRGLFQPNIDTPATEIERMPASVLLLFAPGPLVRSLPALP